jgi:hypothetical protein
LPIHGADALLCLRQPELVPVSSGFGAAEAEADGGKKRSRPKGKGGA